MEVGNTKKYLKEFNKLKKANKNIKISLADINELYNSEITDELWSVNTGQKKGSLATERELENMCWELTEKALKIGFILGYKDGLFYKSIETETPKENKTQD